MCGKKKTKKNEEMGHQKGGVHPSPSFLTPSFFSFTGEQTHLFIHQQEIRRRIIRHHTSDSTRRLQQVADVKVGAVLGAGTRDAQHGGVVGAGRLAPGDDAGGVEAVLRVGGGVGAQPAHGGLAVLDGGGEGRVAAEAVVERGDGGTVAEEAGGHEGGFFAAEHEGAACLGGGVSKYREGV